MRFSNRLAGFTATSSTVKASYSCRIGLASNLAATVAIANPIHRASVHFPPTHFCDFHRDVRLANSRIRRDPCLAHQLWKASYSCRIGIASNLAVTESIAHPIHRASVRFLPTVACESFASLQHASAISTRLYLAARFPISARSVACSTVESVVLLQDRPSQQPRSYLAFANPNQL